MPNKDFYLSLPHDRSGSISKNRFRAELLWGISKILDLMETDENFTIVFDYVCDIEIHYDNKFEFFQVKTHEKNNSYTTQSLTKVSGRGSILGKLYVLNAKANTENILLAVVSNIPYKSMPSAFLTNCFNTLPEKDKSIICKALMSELQLKEIDLSKIYYIQVKMNLEHPENEIRGKLIASFEKIKSCEPTNPNALYRLVFDTVKEKACYEYSSSEYENIIKNKGLTRDEFTKLLDLHTKTSKTSVDSAKKYIETIPDISLKRKYKIALSSVFKTMSESIEIQLLEKEIGKNLCQTDNIGDIDSAIKYLKKNFDEKIPIIMDEIEKTIFYIIIIKRFEEGVYDDETNI